MDNSIKKFNIYHPKNGELNMCCKLDTHEYEFVTTVEVETLVRVFYHTQNDFNKEYAQLSKRSTSVGDIITHNGHVFMMNGVGYKKIPKTSNLYKKVMEIDKIVSSKTLSEENKQELINACYQQEITKIKSVEKTLLLTNKIFEHDNIQ